MKSGYILIGLAAAAAVAAAVAFRGRVTPVIVYEQPPEPAAVPPMPTYPAPDTNVPATYAEVVAPTGFSLDLRAVTGAGLGVGKVMFLDETPLDSAFVTIASGAQISITALPGVNSYFEEWRVGMNNGWVLRKTQENPLVLVMDQPYMVTAWFGLK